MRTALEDAQSGTPPAELLSEGQNPAALLKEIVHWLNEAKAEDVVTIDLAGKSSIGDFMVIVTGRSDRHVGAIAEQLQRKLKDKGSGRVRIEGQDTCDWVLLDTGDIIVHVFRPEVREFYNLEKMWSADRPAERVAH
jgi:ribosome-associated protein